MGERHCLNHPDRPAAGLCYQCHTPVCEECRYDAPARGVFCGEACYDKYIAYQGRKGPAAKGSPLKRLVVALAVLAILAAAAVFIGGELGVPFLKSIRDSILSGGR